MTVIDSMKISWLAPALALLLVPVPRSAAADLTLDDPDGLLARAHAPVTISAVLTPSQRQAAVEGRLLLRETSANPDGSVSAPVQLLANAENDPAPRLCWLLPAGLKGKRSFALEESPRPTATTLATQQTHPGGQFDLTEAGARILRYNYQTIEPGDLLTNVAPGNRIYARARSDYIHPLFGLDGEMLTRDWSRDHPHHRGIYWAWPEVDWRGQRGDLHALQKVFARPTGHCLVTSGPVFAQLDTENLWKWEDRDAIVRERAVIRAYRATPRGRIIDLEFTFTALNDPVLLARRETKNYGGLNIRLAAVKNQRITPHTDPTNANPRLAWGEVAGTFSDAKNPSGVVVLQSAANPSYPGDWVQYPELNWLQPTFPASGARYELKKDQPLVLRYRLWLHRGPTATDDSCADQWRAYHSGSAPTSLKSS